MPLPIIDSEAFLNLPGAPPPFGVTPNFDHPSNLSTPGLAALQFAIATLVVAMRLYTKKVVVRRVLVEDWWLVAAYIVFAGFHVNVFMSEYLPLGVHLWELKVKDAIWHAKIFHLSTAIYALVQLPLKVTLILQIRRIVLPAHTTDYLPSRSRLLLRWTIDFFIVINVVFYLTLFLFQWLMCRPLRKAWDFRVPGTCVPHRLIVHIASASINTASDLITMILPQPVIWKLNLQRKRKWGLSAVFLLGGLACAASACRLYYTVRLYYTTDLTYVAGLMAKCVSPELTLGFLAACVPALPAFLKHIRRSTPFLKARGLWTSSPASETQHMGTGTFGSAGRRIRKEVLVEFESREVEGSESPVESRVQSWCGEKEGEEWGGGGGAGGAQGARPGRVMQWK